MTIAAPPGPDPRSTIARPSASELRAGVLMLGPEGAICFSTAGARAILGLSAEELHGRVFLDLPHAAIDEDGRPIPAAAHPAARALATGQAVADEILGLTRPGATAPTWVQVSAEPQLAPGGQVVQVVCTFVDITAHKRAEEARQEVERRFQDEHRQAQEALRRSEERFAKTFRSSPDAILITRLADGQMIDANDSWCAMTGYSRGEAARQGSPRSYLWEDAGQWDAIYERARREGAVRDFDFGFRTKAGEARLGNLSADIISIEGEECLLLVIRDITVRTRLEEQMRAAERLTALGRLAAGVAHEFNNILAAIMGRVDLLALGAPEAEASLRLIQQALDDGAAVVRRIQMFARLRDPGEFQAIGVGDLVNDVTSLTQSHWQIPATGGAQGIILRTQVEQGLDVLGDPTELREVLTNLILNAVDALPQGGRIFVGAEARGKNVVITVRDTGVGMDAATQARIFEPFFTTKAVGSSRVDLQACKLEYSIVSPK